MTHVRSSIRIVWMTHVRTSPYYPQSNGKIERWHGTLKRECIRPGVLLNLDDAKSVVGDYIHHYNNVRLNSAIGYIAPIDKLNGRSEEMQILVRLFGIEEQIRKNLINVAESIKPGNGSCGN